MFWAYLASPFMMVLGLYLLVRCIMALSRIISPSLRYRFSASSDAYRFSLPKAGRYVVNVVIPAFTFITGVSYFSARFDVTPVPPASATPYRSYGRSPFQVRRSDMSGKTSYPLGRFECTEPGEFDIRCLNPETIRSNFQLEISPYVSPLLLVPLILATILTFAMTTGGLILSIHWLASLKQG